MNMQYAQAVVAHENGQRGRLAVAVNMTSSTSQPRLMPVVEAHRYIPRGLACL